MYTDIGSNLYEIGNKHFFILVPMLSQLQFFFISLTACNGWLVLHGQTLDSWLHKTNEQLEGLGTRLRESARVFEGSEE